MTTFQARRVTTGLLGLGLGSAIVLGAWALRVYGLGAQSLWLDESYSYDVARRGPLATLALVASEDRHPPLHYLVLWAAMRLAGASEYALRLPSAAAGTLLVALAVRIGRWAGGWAVGLLGGLLLTLSPFLVWYSQEARMYALLAAFGAASFLAWLRLVERWDRWTAVGYVAATAAALYTHYYAAFLLPAQLIALAAIRWRWRPLVAMAAAGLLLLPWLPVLARQAGRGGAAGYRPDTPIGQVVGGLLAAYPFGDSFPVPGAAVAVVALAVGMGVLNRRGWASSAVPGSPPGHPPRGDGADRRGWILLAWVAVAPLAAYAISAGIGIEMRATGRMYYLAGAPAFLLLAARGVLSLARWRTALGVGRTLVALTGLGLVAAQAIALEQQMVGRAREDWRGTARTIERRAWPGDAIAIVAEPIFRDQPFAYYYRGGAPVEVLDAQAEGVEARLRRIAAAHPRLWLLLVHGPIADPTNRVETWLDRELTPLEDVADPDVHLRLYSSEARPRLDAPTVERRVGTRLGNAVELVGTDGGRVARPGGILRIELVWQALRPLTRPYHVALMLADAGGRVRAQTDRVALSPFYDPTRWQVGEYLTDRYDLPVPSDLPDGGYRLRLRFYDPASGETLAAPSGELADVGPVRVGAPNTAVPSPTHWLGARLGGQVELLGYDLDGEMRPGSNPRLTLWWRALTTIPRDYTVFTHLVGPDGTLRAQHDGPPGAGSYPTSIWEPGEVVKDEHDLPIAGGGPYRLEVGMYLADTGERLGEVVVDIP